MNNVVAVQSVNQNISLIDSVDLSQIQMTMQKIAQFQAVVQQTLKQNHDFGIVPGTSKPTLLKPGAEKILMMMGITSEYEVIEKVHDYERGFFAFTVKCILTKSCQKITEGVGHCNTKEKKYIKQDAYTLANTCLKMAKKRAQIDATLTVASLSEIFTQDMEDVDLQGNATIGSNSDPDSHKKPEEVICQFKKHKGKTMGQVLKEDRSYVEWIAKNAENQTLKNAANELLKSQHGDQEESEEEMLESGDVPFDDSDIPF